MLLEGHTGRNCGLAIIPMKDGKAQIDLPSMGFQTQTETAGAGALLAVIIHHPADLVKLPHYVYWTEQFDQIAAEIKAVDIALVTDAMVQ